MSVHALTGKRALRTEAEKGEGGRSPRRNGKRRSFVSRTVLSPDGDGHVLAYFNRSRQRTYGWEVGRVVNHVKNLKFPSRDGCGGS